MIKKGYLQISFAWLFAIIVGAFILFLAIFLSTKVIHQGNTATDVITSKELGILLNPLETGFESGKVNKINLKSKIRIYNKCTDEGFFGKQIIQTSRESFGKWTKTDIDVSFKNKYIFSNKTIEGDSFYLFSKPFEFPFKIADLIYITSDKTTYCFKNAPSSIQEELGNLNQKNILFENCSNSDIKVCFNSIHNCDIKVNYLLKTVNKNGKTLYFNSDSLMYAAIFSDPKIYECQLKRLMKRVVQLSLLYKDKSQIISKSGCNSNANLLALNNLAKTYENSRDLNSISLIANELKAENENAQCKLW